MSFIETVDPHYSSGKRESYETIFNVSNTMMGTALLIMPCNFYNSGVISSILAALVMMFISFWTCNLIVIHSKDDEIDYPLAIKRLLGPIWERIFNFLSFLLLLLIAIIHFILMANVALSIIKNLSGNSENVAGLKEITFKKFSMQYMGFILFVLCGYLYSLKDIKKILVINDKGIYMIFLYCIFVIYLGISALVNEEITFVTTGEIGKANEGLELILFNTDLTELVGVFSVAYMVHNAVCGMMKSNKNSENNTRDLLIAYCIVFFNYALLGLFGCFAVSALYHHDYYDEKGLPKSTPKSILELLSNESVFLGKFSRIFGLISLFFVFVQLTTVLPILNFFTRRQFFGLILGSEKEESNLQTHIFNLVFNLICLGFEIPVFEPGVVVAWTGALGSLMLIYVIPIWCHLKCLYFNNNRSASNQLMTGDEENNKNNNTINLKDMKEDENSKNLLERVNDSVACCRTDHTHETTYSKWIIFPFYAILASIGFAILGVSIYNNVK